MRPVTYLAVLESASTKLVVVCLYVFYKRCCIYDALVCNVFKRCIALYNQKVSIYRSPLADFQIGLLRKQIRTCLFGNERE